jgi:phosphonate transport system substrate-binding protein
MLDLVNGKLELAVLPPLVYLNARHERPLETLGYGVYRASGHFSYHSLILVRADSKAASLAELSGKKVAFVDIMSASGYVVPKAALVKAGVAGKKDVKGSFHQNHVDAVRALLRGEVDAAATYDLVFSDSREIAEQKDKLRTLWTGDVVIPSDAVVATPEVSAELRGKLTDALLGYHTAQKQKRAPENRVYGAFVPADPHLYNDLERFLAEFTKQ